MRPLHVTFTGLDGATSTHELLALSRDFPIEWGILFHPTREGSGRYPALTQIQSVAECDLKVSAHLCGGYARSVVHGESLPAPVVSLLNRFSRIQINTSERGIEPERIARFAGRFGARGILQCRGFEHFPDNTHVDWLFDRSGGTGSAARAMANTRTGGHLRRLLRRARSGDRRRCAHRNQAPASGVRPLLDRHGGRDPDRRRVRRQQVPAGLRDRIPLTTAKRRRHPIFPAASILSTAERKGV